MNILDYKDSLREGPPRKISFFSTVKVLFDDYTVQIGGAVLALGLFFMQLSVGQSKFMELINISGDWEQTSGRFIKGSQRVSSRGNELFKHQFEFSVEGKLYKGTSYGPLKKADRTENCLIEYREFNPRRSRVVGTEAELHPALAACFLLLPFLGLIIMAIGLKGNLRALFLLKYGIVSQGKTLSVTPVAASGGGRAYRFVFEFKVNDNVYEANCLTKEKEIVEDDDLYNVLYNEKNPSKNIVYDALGHIPAIGRLGNVKEGNPASTFYLGLIFISLLANIYLYYQWYW
jgi:hypothetical protein